MVDLISIAYTIIMKIKGKILNKWATEADYIFHLVRTYGLVKSQRTALCLDQIKLHDRRGAEQQVNYWRIELQKSEAKQNTIRRRTLKRLAWQQ